MNLLPILCTYLFLNCSFEFRKWNCKKSGLGTWWRPTLMLFLHVLNCFQSHEYLMTITAGNWDMRRWWRVSEDARLLYWLRVIWARRHNTLQFTDQPKKKIPICSNWDWTLLNKSPSNCNQNQIRNWLQLNKNHPAKLETTDWSHGNS